MLFAIYLGTGLGLLMLTSLFGLERYLRKRGAQIPTGVVKNWFLLGTLFALAIMSAFILMPRPDLSSQFENAVSFLTSPNRKPSNLAIGNRRSTERRSTHWRKSR